MEIKKLSIIVPAYNEKATIAKVINRLGKLKTGKTIKEIIVVDDGSTDGTGEILKRLKNKSKFTLITKDGNEGKGAAIKAGFLKANGEYLVIQDADLEYDPQEMKKLIEEAKRTGCDAVYGTRNKGISNNYAYPVLYWGAKVLIWMVNIVYGQKLSDPECCYKLMKRELLDFEITEKGFGVEVELTAKLAKQGVKIKEVPIKYKPRTYEEGKKIRAGDGIRAVWLALKWAV